MVSGRRAHPSGQLWATSARTPRPSRVNRMCTPEGSSLPRGNARLGSQCPVNSVHGQLSAKPYASPWAEGIRGVRETPGGRRHQRGPQGFLNCLSL